MPRLLWLIWGVTLVSCFIELQFTPLRNTLARVEFNQIRSELPQAKARWEATGITSYDVGVWMFSASCIQDVSLKVRGSELSEVIMMTRSRWDAIPSPVALVERESWPDQDGWCAYNNVLVPQMFDTVEKALEELKPEESDLSVTFDEQYGFVGYYRRVCRAVSHCVTEIHLEDFQPLADASP